MALTFRHGQILRLARQQGQVVVEDLARHFEVSVQTIRRDLADLCDAGQLARVHGGAVLPSGVSNIGYEQRRSLHAAAKDGIAAAIARRIPAEASVFLGIGTTTEAVARALLSHRNLMVVTNNMNVANILAANASSQVVVAGGVLRPADGGLVGDMTLELIRQFKVDVAVIGASALDEDGDLLDFDHREVRVSQAIIRQARQVWLAADASKFSRTAPVRIAALAEIDAFFTDAPPPPAVADLCRERETEVVIALAANPFPGRQSDPDQIDPASTM